MQTALRWCCPHFRGPRGIRYDDRGLPYFLAKAPSLSAVDFQRKSLKIPNSSQQCCKRPLLLILPACVKLFKCLLQSGKQQTQPVTTRFDDWVPTPDECCLTCSVRTLCVSTRAVDDSWPALTVVLARRCPALIGVFFIFSCPTFCELLFCTLLPFIVAFVPSCLCSSCGTLNSFAATFLAAATTVSRRFVLWPYMVHI